MIIFSWIPENSTTLWDPKLSSNSPQNPIQITQVKLHLQWSKPCLWAWFWAMCLCTDRFDLESPHSLVSDTAAFTWRIKLEQHLYIPHLLEPMLWGKNFHWHNFRNEKEKRKITPVWITVLLHFRVGLSLYIILKRALRELEGPED